MGGCVASNCMEAQPVFHCPDHFRHGIHGIGTQSPTLAFVLPYVPNQVLASRLCHFRMLPTKLRLLKRLLMLRRYKPVDYLYCTCICLFLCAVDFFATED